MPEAIKLIDAIPPNPPKFERLSPEAWRVIGVVMLAPFMTQMDSTIVNVSLSSIRDDLHSTISAAQWVISAYLLALALMLPVNGWLVDRFGAKKLYLLCFSAFTAASFFCGAAHTMGMLICARVLQGMSGGLLVPLTQYMLARVAGPKNIARVAGYAMMPVLVAPLIGPSLAAAILKHEGWPWLFYVNLPVGLIATILAARILPADHLGTVRRSFDAVGFALLSPGLVFFLYGFEQLSHHESCIWFLAGVTLILAFALRARRVKAKGLIDFDLFKIPSFATAAGVQFLANGILYCGQFLVPLFFINGAGLTPSAAGLVLSSAGLGAFLVFPMMGTLNDRLGCRTLASSGVLLNFVGTLPLVWMAYAGYSLWLAVAALILRGVGQGVTAVPTLAAAYSAIPKEQLSYATTSINIVQRLGGPIFTTLLAMVVATFVQMDAPPNTQQFAYPMIALIVLQLAVLVIAVRLPKRVE